MAEGQLVTTAGGFVDRDAFVGRVAELEAIIDALATDEGRSITDVALEKVSLGELDPVNAL